MPGWSIPRFCGNGNGTVSARTTHPKPANTRKVKTLKVLFLHLISIEKTQNYGFLSTRCHSRNAITSMAEYKNMLIGIERACLGHQVEQEPDLLGAYYLICCESIT